MARDAGSAGDSSACEPAAPVPALVFAAQLELGNAGRADLRRRPGAEPGTRLTVLHPPRRRRSQVTCEGDGESVSLETVSPQKELLPGQHWLLKEEAQSQANTPEDTNPDRPSLGSRAVVYASCVA